MSIPSASAVSFPIAAAIVPLSVLGVPVVRVEIVPGVASLPPSFSAGFFSETGALEVRRDFTLTPEQWDQWGEGVSDRDYILTCAAANLGFELAP